MSFFFFFLPSMVMVRRTSTGTILQCGKSEPSSSRNSIHEGLREKYFSLFFSLASPVGFVLLQKNAVVLKDSWRGTCLWSNHVFEYLRSKQTRALHGQTETDFGMSHDNQTISTFLDVYTFHM